jgi:LysM repeat protein
MNRNTKRERKRTMKRNIAILIALVGLLALDFRASAEELKPTAAARTAKPAETATVNTSLKPGPKPKSAVPETKKLPTPGLIPVKPPVQPTSIAAQREIPPVDHGLSTYTVRKGDTLSAIARRYGLRTAKLRSLNRLLNPDKIQVGQRLRIPGASMARSAKPRKMKKPAIEGRSTAAADPTEIRLILGSK